MILAADSDIEAALASLLLRTRDLRTHPFGFDIRRHPQRDAGCRTDAANFLRPFLRTHRHALVVFDWDGCGSHLSREQTERAVEDELDRNGWGSRARAVVIDPEVEAWVWTNSSAVTAALGWERDYPQLQAWLRERGLWARNAAKPDDPKAAMVRALRKTRTRRSARVYGTIAKGVDFGRCADQAFHKLIGTLRDWFPREDGRDRPP